MSGACNTQEEIINAHKIFVGNPDSKNLLGIRRYKWEDNIKMNPKKTVSLCGLTGDSQNKDQ